MIPESRAPNSAEPIIAFIGGGNMARSLIAAQLARDVRPMSIRVAEPRAEAREELTREFGVPVFAGNTEAVGDADCVVLAVKPQVIRPVCEGLAAPLDKTRALVISIAAGVRIAQLEHLLGAARAIIRCMPNTPAMVGAGAAALCANHRVSGDQRELAENVLGAAGIVRWVEDEAEMDAVTALSGSGPAYFFLLAEAMEDAAVRLGLPRETARALAAQTCLGAGTMLTNGDATAAELRQRVTSPHGTTAAALEAFERGGLRDLAQRALTAAHDRGAALSAELEAEKPEA